MMTLGISFLLAMSAALISTGESGALLVGMRDASGPAAWMTPVNAAYAISDIALGLGAAGTELAGKGDSWPARALLGAIALSCAARFAQYCSGSPHPFCENTPLLVVNAAKLVLSAGAVTASLCLK